MNKEADRTLAIKPLSLSQTLTKTVIYTNLHEIYDLFT